MDETYIHVHILSSFGHARSWAQPLAWQVIVSAAGGKIVGGGGGGGGGEFGN